MLLSVVITLRAEQDAEPRPRGRAVHAWFLNQVARHDPGMADYLHAGASGVRPFTTSDVRWRFDAYSSKGLPILRGKRYAIRITSIMPALSHLLLRQWLPNLPSRLVLAGAPFEVTGALDRADDHPWAGRATRRALWQRFAEGASSHFKMLFASPTTFRSRGVFVPLPWPSLVFNGLFKKWNLFAELPLPRDALEMLTSSLVIRGYALQATGVALDGDARIKTPAFWGHCDYAVLSKNAHLQRLAHTLAAFALFASVGRETTRGWGQCRLVEETSPE